MARWMTAADLPGTKLLRHAGLSIVALAIRMKA
jgi:hypothetical protein